MDMKSGVTWPGRERRRNKHIKPPKFTGGRAAGGWEIRRSDDGLVRFNELIALVKKDRATMKRGTGYEKKERAALRKYRLVANASGDLNRSSRGTVAIHDCLFSDDDST
jgi:hypothetical protein